LILEFPVSRENRSEFFQISGPFGDARRQFVPQFQCIARKFANLLPGQGRDLFWPAQGTLLTPAGNSSVGTGMPLGPIGFMKSIHQARFHADAASDGAATVILAPRQPLWQVPARLGAAGLAAGVLLP
jgi:hypothetical protein